MIALGQPNWTDTRIDALKALAADGSTSGQICKELGITRSAVLGKLHRLGISLVEARESAPRPAKVQRRARFRRPPRKKIRVVSIQPQRNSGHSGPVAILECDMLDLPPDASEFACTIVELKPDMCRWPLSEPADMRYCGAPCDGTTYCARHSAIAYRPAPRRA